MNKVRVLGVFLVLMVVVVFALPVQVRAGAEVWNEPVEIWWFNECTNEWVYITGSTNNVFKISFDGQGCLHYTYHRNSQNNPGVGVPSGNKYRTIGGVGENYQHGSVCGGAPWVIFYHQFLKVVSQGGADNAVMHIVYRVIVNANGEVKVYHDMPGTWECIGANQ